MLKKPIKRSEYLKPFSKDHHFSLLFCWKIRQGLRKEVALERICKYVQYFWQQHLLPHFEEEELILFTPVNGRPVQRAIREHTQIRQQVEALANCLGNNVQNRLAKLADMVDKHVRYEERELFPHLERKLNKEQLEDIGKQIRKHYPSSLQDQYEDQFWNT